MDIITPAQLANARRRAKSPSRARPVTLDTLNAQLASRALPHMHPEFRFHPYRRWRFDGVWVPQRIAVEIEGGGFVAGRHSRGLGLEKDCEKYAAALLGGWSVLRVTPRQVRNGLAVAWLAQLWQVIP